MKIFLSLLLAFISLYGQKVLVLNSNDTVVKYKETIDAFSKEFKEPFLLYNIANKSDNTIKEYLYDEYPDVIYTVGAKAYQYAYEYLPEKEIYFSTIVNWKRLMKAEHTNGVSNELHSGMHLTLIKSIFSDVKNIGVIYSVYTKDIVKDFQINSQSLDINIVPYKIDNTTINEESFHMLLNKVDAIIVIPDPVLLNKQAIVKKLFHTSKKRKKAIFAYHELFLDYGALLSISIDNPTTGRQIARMIQNDTKTNNKKYSVKYPAGTKVIFNKKEALNQNILFNKNITSLVNEIKE